MYEQDYLFKFLTHVALARFFYNAQQLDVICDNLLHTYQSHAV